MAAPKNRSGDEEAALRLQHHARPSVKRRTHRRQAVANDADHLSLGYHLATTHGRRGGFWDRRHMLAAFALGADMVQVGTAFLTTPESGLPPPRKAAITAATSSTASVVTRGLTGRPARMLRNELVDRLAPHEVDAASSALQRQRMADIFRTHDTRYSVLLAGQGHAYCRLDDTVATVLARFA
ncbi:hypothetical protein SPRG_15627 [Saprolegnia parasitica CBS 223.65]|uniref:Uncharacterized protein n=1 Tax=Saprolegnia parasitica (strain CBS 223.65) TaxID=695850 RepID=A0A067BF38_SAPPC|nr:hypothetical protein SPRG_15627 [Saprolegnia parasitica CBS 223.65]KDO17004.1 hypothetical protein SPRG_15627 [Saprolegnia parasitica CBS 223.65]|eukprot:XP_012212286.1 hypothetical protein SPRG_15627 [Saprolegnia parasitica CBS 223.65]